MNLKLNVGAVAVALALSSLAQADEMAIVPEAAGKSETAAMPEVVVTGEKMAPLPSSSNAGLEQDSLQHKHANTSDTTKLLDGQPGVSFYGAGGVSSLPAIHGMADDRVRVKVDGMDLISACANHMNAPLSYIDPADVGGIKVFAGIAPVSAGGDSIGGTILVNSYAPEFAREGQGILRKGQAGILYRSNGNAKGANLAASIASETMSMSYRGAAIESGNYLAAGTFRPAGPAATGPTGTGSIPWLAGNEVASTRYKSENHAIGLAMRQDNHVVDLKLGLQEIPYQGFPNQRMDMTRNNSKQANLGYTGQYQWGSLEARVYDEHTRHSMNFGDDKLMNPNPTGMPMDTDGKNTGAQIKAGIALGEKDVLNVGSEYQRYRLNDWWSRSGNGGMAPNTFWNINDGQRDRFNLFAEWESHVSQKWASLLGIRSETVTMNTGAVQGYCNSTTTPACVDTRYLNVANAFNARDRKHTDHNLDLTALARYTPDTNQAFEVGYAMKTRSPNLYERYTWSTQSTMVLNMNNWFGDGNGYVGNMDLKPEVAHTLSAAANWHAEDARELRVAPYYTHVANYIDAVACPACVTRTDGFANLTFANQSARLYGADISGRMLLSRDGNYGSFSMTGVVSYVNGKNLTTGDNLYNIMPLNMKLAVEQRLGSWTNAIEVKLVDAKSKVQSVRKEMRTGGYGLLNLYSSYEWKQARFDIGLENALNKFYASPLGGAYVGQGSTMGTAVPHGVLVPGMGRSINTALTVKF